MSLKKLLVILVSCLFLIEVAAADVVKLRADHPERYVVVKGDTLWDISAHFLKDPWLWPKIWHINPEIKNPHLIYPGDVISLIFIDGKPQLRLERKGRPVIKLSPTGRVEELHTAIPTIPADAIRQFLKRPSILTKAELDKAPYILANDGGHLITGSDEKVYVRGLEDTVITRFNVVHEGDAYRDIDDEILGYEALSVADAKLVKRGDPSTLYLKSASREILIGDKVLPARDDADIDPYFTPEIPDIEINGRIIAVLDGVSRIGQYHTVVLNKGRRDHIKVGHILASYQAGESIEDTIGEGHDDVTLPNEQSGTLMVVRVFERASYALVMRATRTIRINDEARNPDSRDNL